MMGSEKNRLEAITLLDNSEEPLRRALFFGIGAVLTVALSGVVIAGTVVGMPGVWGALLGAGISGIFSIITVAVGLLTRKFQPNIQLAVILGSWVLKIFFLLAVFILLKGMTFYDRPSFIIVLLVSLVAILTAETFGIKKAQVPYVQPKC